MVAVDILKKDLPFIGAGLWRMDPQLMDDPKFMKRVEGIIKAAQEKMEKVKDAKNRKIQSIWMETKAKIRGEAKQRKKEKAQQVRKKKDNLKREIDFQLVDISSEAVDVHKRLEELRQIKGQLRDLVSRESKDIQERAKARYKHLGEKSTKYWFKLKREKIDENIILALRKKNGSLTKKTADMRDVAVDHHETLQARPEMTNGREEAIEKIE